VWADDSQPRAAELPSFWGHARLAAAAAAAAAAADRTDAAAELRASLLAHRLQACGSSATG